MNRTIRAFAIALAALYGLAGSLGVQAQDYPIRPIKLIVPFSAGGPTDVTARSVAQRMGAILGQPVVVDNRTGAGSTLGTDVVAKAPADGYTLLFGTLSLAINATLYPKLPYDTVADFAPVGKVVNTYLVLVTTPSFPANNLKEFVDVLKANPGKYNYGTAGIGSCFKRRKQLASELVVNGVEFVRSVQRQRQNTVANF